MAADGDHRREAPREALDGHVVRGGDEHRAAEVGRVGELVEELRELLLRRREAHVDDVVALLDRPAQTGERGSCPLPRVAGAEHADAVELALGSDRADDPGARGAVPADVALGVVVDDRLAVLAERDRRPRRCDARRRAGARLDAAVEDADADARAGRAAERPLAGDRGRPAARGARSSTPLRRGGSRPEGRARSCGHLLPRSASSLGAHLPTIARFFLRS